MSEGVFCASLQPFGSICHGFFERSWFRGDARERIDAALIVVFGFPADGTRKGDDRFVMTFGNARHFRRDFTIGCLEIDASFCSDDKVCILYRIGNLDIFPDDIEPGMKYCTCESDKAGTKSAGCTTAV